MGPCLSLSTAVAFWPLGGTRQKKNVFHCITAKKGKMEGVSRQNGRGCTGSELKLFFPPNFFFFCVGIFSLQKRLRLQLHTKENGHLDRPVNPFMAQQKIGWVCWTTACCWCRGGGGPILKRGAQDTTGPTSEAYWPPPGISSARIHFLICQSAFVLFRLPLKAALWRPQWTWMQMIVFSVFMLSEIL